MKLTIEPSQQYPDYPVDEQPRKISIEVAADDLDLNHIIDNLIIPALKAMEYSNKNIEERITK